MMKKSGWGMKPNMWVDSICITILVTLLFFLFLGSRPLFVPDEGRYAEIAREMATSNDFVTPYLNYVKYFEKPVLYYWLTALAIKLAGINLWIIRSVNALFGLLICLFTYFVAYRLYNRRTALLAAGILATSPLYFVMAHMITLDMPVTVFITASLYCFLLSFNLNQTTHQNRWREASAAFAGLAVLTKGLIGIVFPLAIIGLWTTLYKKWQVFKSIKWFSILFIFSSIVIPWHALVIKHNPEFFYFYFIEQHFLRYTMPDIGHLQPGWYFLAALFIGFFPWIVFLSQAFIQYLRKMRQNWRNQPFESYFFIWITFIFLFFSFSKSKLIPYILPMFPPLSIFVAHYLDSSLQQNKILGIKCGFLLFLIFTISIVAIYYFFPHQVAIPDARKASYFLTFSALIFLTGAIAACLYAHRAMHAALTVTMFTSGLFLILSMAAVPYIDARSIQPLAMLLKTKLNPQETVITYNQYYQDLPFYLEHQVSILNWQNELTFGLQHQPAITWMINDQKFKELLNNHKKVYIFINKSEYEHLKAKFPTVSFIVLGETLITLLVSNVVEPISTS